MKTLFWLKKKQLKEFLKEYYDIFLIKPSNTIQFYNFDYFKGENVDKQ